MLILLFLQADDYNRINIKRERNSDMDGAQYTKAVDNFVQRNNFDGIINYQNLSLSLDDQRARNLKLAISSAEESFVLKKSMKILFSDAHKETVKKYLELYSVGINFESEDVIRQFWSQICIHMLMCILGKICDVLRLPNDQNSIDSSDNGLLNIHSIRIHYLQLLVNKSQLPNFLMMYGLYNKNYSDNSFIEMALLADPEKRLQGISASNILCSIYSDDAEIKLDFWENRSNCPHLYHYFDNELVNILGTYLTRIEQYYYLMPRKQLMIVDQQADISDIDLQMDRLILLPLRRQISYTIKSNDIQFLVKHLKKWDLLINDTINEREKEIKDVSITIFRDFVLDVLTKIFGLKLSDNLYCLKDDMVKMNQSFAYSFLGRYNTLDLRGKQKVGHNHNGKYHKEIKITRSLLTNGSPALFVVPLRAVINFHYDQQSHSLMYIDCFNLNSFKKNDPFVFFCREMQTRVDNLFHEFMERLYQDYTF